MPVSMMITAWFTKRRGLAMSITLAGIGLGGSILAPLVNQFILNYGWRTAYQYTGFIIILIACPVVFFILRPTPESMGLKAYGEDSTIEEKKSGKLPLHRREILKFLLAKASVNLSFGSSCWDFFLWDLSVPLLCVR